MAHLHVTQYNEESIRQPSKAVTLDDIRAGTFRKLVKDMLETMYAENGIGIAAPQVGVNLRIIIVETKDGPIVMMNPVIQKKSLRKETVEEGCLSVKGIFGPVPRHRSLTVKGYDEKGESYTMQAEGLLARIFQHEVDHLNGGLFIDRAKGITHGTFDLKKWKRRPSSF
ncbi:MAG: peptide deformylase [Candidatus Nomurabacteria bacterium]|nr:MAG: peptide deformylase [Candidatus Nomurabacteria bacterium]